MRSRKLYEPFKKERVPESAYVCFILKYPVLCQRVHDLFKWYCSYLDVGRFKPSQWTAAGKTYRKHADTQALVALLYLTFGYAGPLTAQSSCMSRFHRIYEKHFVK